jgi:ABC-type taurine transport system substrate-binding protein
VTDETDETEEAEPADVDAALAEANHWLDDVPGVVAVAQGEDQGAPTVDVWVARREAGDALPRRLHGVTVRVLDAGGPIRAQDDSRG